MALGKSLILLVCISGTAFANSTFNPNFYTYQSNSVIERILAVGFGWNKKLNDNQKDAYHQSIVHALEYAENGDKVNWYRDNASGYTVPVMTWPKGPDYCRRLHINIIAYNKQKSFGVTACSNSSTNSWDWYRDK